MAGVKIMGTVASEANCGTSRFSRNNIESAKDTVAFHVFASSMLGMLSAVLTANKHWYCNSSTLVCIVTYNYYVPH